MITRSPRACDVTKRRADQYEKITIFIIGIFSNILQHTLNFHKKKVKKNQHKNVLVKFSMRLSCF